MKPSKKQIETYEKFAKGLAKNISLFNNGFRGRKIKSTCCPMCGQDPLKTLKLFKGTIEKEYDGVYFDEAVDL